MLVLFVAICFIIGIQIGLLYRVGEILNAIRDLCGDMLEVNKSILRRTDTILLEVNASNAKTVSDDTPSQPKKRGRKRRVQN